MKLHKSDEYSINKENKGTKVNQRMIILLAIYISLSVLGLIPFKLGANRGISLTATGGALGLRISWISIIGLCCYILSFILYMVIISKANLSYIYPISVGLCYIFVLAASYLVLKEKASLWSIIGTGFILIGIIIINVSK
jgi:drug/metabolite transporter (DMT)-like permease